MAKDNMGSRLKPSASPSLETNDRFSNLSSEDAYRHRVIGSAFPIRDMPSTHPHIPCQDLCGATSSCNEDILTTDASSSTDIFQFSNLARIVEPVDCNMDAYNVFQCRVDSVTPSPVLEWRTAALSQICSHPNSPSANNMENRTTPLQCPLSERNVIGVGGGINIAPQNSIANLQNIHDYVVEASQLDCSAYLQDSHAANKQRCVQDNANISLSLDLLGRELTCSNDLTPQLAEDLMMYDRSQPVGFLTRNEGDGRKSKDDNETCGRVLSESVEKLDGKSLTLGRGGSDMVPESAVSKSSSTHKADGDILSQVSACNQDDHKTFLHSYPSTGGFLSSPVNALHESPVVHSDSAISSNTKSKISPTLSNILQPQLANSDLIARNSNLGLIESQNVANAYINSRNISYAGFPLSHETKLLHNQNIGDSSRQQQMTHFPSSFSQPFYDTAQTAFDVIQRAAMLTDCSLPTASTQMNLPVRNPGIFAVSMVNSPGFPQWQETPLVCNQTIQPSSQQHQLTHFPASLSQPFHYTAIDNVQRGPALSDWRLSTAPTQMNSPLRNPGMFTGPTNNPQGFHAWVETILRQNENAQHSYQQHQKIPFPSSLPQHLHTTVQRTLDEVQRDTTLTNLRLSIESTPVNSLVGTPGSSTSPMDNQPGNCGQPQADHQVEPRSNVSIPLSAEIKGHGHPQISNMHRGGLRKRGGGQSPLATAPIVRRPRTQPRPQPQIPRLQSTRNQSSLVPLSSPGPIQSYPKQESKSPPRGRNVGQTSPSLLSSQKVVLPRCQQSPVHIKCGDKDEEHQLTGNRCFICKRDLSYPPEGPIVHPPNLLPVAVLPCGHTFHDHCLQQITPENDVTNPPCIPCALGDGV